MPSHEPKYTPIDSHSFNSSSEDIDTEALLLDSSNTERIWTPFRSKERLSRAARVVPWVLAVLSWAVAGVLYFRGGGGQECACGKAEREIYSPFWDTVEYYTTTFSGTLDAPSVYRGIPTPENRPRLDAAWDELTGAHGTGMLRIPESSLSKLNKSTISVKYPEELGGGYMAGTETLHQLHCLDVLRKHTYKEYYADDMIFMDSPKTQLTHKDHCIEMIRQVLMCNADTGVVTYNWVEGRKRPYPDFNTKHVCRNWTKVRDWVRENQVQGDHELTITEGAVPIPTLP